MINWDIFFDDVIKQSSEHIEDPTDDTWGSVTTANTYESLYLPLSSTLYPSNTLYPGTLKTSETLYD